MYIYTIHTHKMLNIVTKQINIPEAVLIRAIEPLE
ncbi:MAG: DNA-3-methyladenine glycosylase [Candidatus Peribacteria bacterium]|nr:DNA-3-methyladenine glycosylase [Candidatus Peribacteria bacterium]